MVIPSQKPDSKYTYADYCSWPDTERWEILDGVPVAMSPFPNRYHQKISGRLYFAVQAVLNEKKIPCEIYAAPFDVRLPEYNEADESVTNVVQPDLSIICDKNKLDDRGCRGAPDVIIEILSPSTASNDMIVKKELYEKHRVREYWIVQPMERIVIVYKLTDTPEENRAAISSVPGKFDKGSIYTEKDEIIMHIPGEIRIRLSDIFAD